MAPTLAAAPATDAPPDAAPEAPQHHPPPPEPLPQHAQPPQHHHQHGEEEQARARHHLLRHCLPNELRGQEALRHFNCENTRQAVRKINKMPQKELQVGRRLWRGRVGG